MEYLPLIVSMLFNIAIVLVVIVLARSIVALNRRVDAAEAVGVRLEQDADELSAHIASIEKRAEARTTGI